MTETETDPGRAPARKLPYAAGCDGEPPNAGLFSKMPS